MRTIAFQTSNLESATYLMQAVHLSLAHNPDTVFALSCNVSWHATLQGLVAADPRLSMTEDILIPDFDLTVRRIAAWIPDHSIPRTFVKAFNHFAERMKFNSGLERESQLLFNVEKKFVGVVPRVLFINEPNRFISAADMDSLAQSIHDRRAGINVTRPTQARGPFHAENLDMISYGYMASLAGCVIGPACAQMALTFNESSIQRVNSWITIDPQHHYPFNDRCHRAGSVAEAVEKLRQFGLV